MRNSWLFLCAVFLGICPWFTRPALAQEQRSDRDSTIIVEDTLRVGTEGLMGASKPGVETAPDTAVVKTTNKGHIPRKAALFSAVLPGLGQIYNDRYWKVPIIYAGFASLGYAYALTNDKYQLFRRALIAEQNNAGEENPLRGIRSGFYERTELLNLGVENFRRDRDFMIILIAGVYALQIMDAIVDAHLIEFDVNEDLSLQLRPSGNSTGIEGFPGFGMSLTLSIR